MDDWMYFRILRFYTMIRKIDWVMWCTTDWFNHMLAEILDIYNNAISSIKLERTLRHSQGKIVHFYVSMKINNKKNLVYACSNDHSENYDITFLPKWMIEAIRIFILKSLLLILNTIARWKLFLDTCWCFWINQIETSLFVIHNVY